MNENHKLENILAGIGSEPVSDDIHRLAENIVDAFRRGLSADTTSISPEPQGPGMVGRQETSQQGDDSTDSLAPIQPAARLVPDVPTELADGVPCETHPIIQPPDRRHVPRRFIAMLQSRMVRWSVAAAAAAAVILVIGFWPGRNERGAGSALAAAIQKFQNAKTIVRRISSSVTGGPMTIQQKGKLEVSSEYGCRCEMGEDGTTPMLIQYSPLHGPMTTVMPLTHTYTVVDMQAVGGHGHGPQGIDSPDAFILALSKLKGHASRELGRATVDGIDSLGYEITGELLGLGSGEGVRSELWIDARTCLPVRYMAEMPGPELSGGKGGKMQIVYDQFEWDTPLDPNLFVPDIPAGYTRIDAKAPVPDEASLIKGLGNYAELAGKYPPALDATTMTTDLAAAVGRRIASALARGEKAPDQKELMQKSLEIGSGMSFYRKLVREGRSAEYHGKTVLPGQADAVLLRWKLPSGEWRVIYGDLRIETINDKR